MFQFQQAYWAGRPLFSVISVTTRIAVYDGCMPVATRLVRWKHNSVTQPFLAGPNSVNPEYILSSEMVAGDCWRGENLPCPSRLSE